MSRAVALQVFATCAAFCLQYAAPHINFLPRAVAASPGATSTSVARSPPPPSVPAILPQTRHRPPPQTNQQTRTFANGRNRTHALPDSREASLLPPFGSPAVLPPQSLHKKRARRNARRSAHTPAPQPFVPIAHSTQASQVPSLIDLRVVAPPLLQRVNTPSPLCPRAVQPLVQELASDQQPLAPLRKKARVAVRIVDGNELSQCSATAYGGYGATASASREHRKPTQNQLQEDAAPAESPVVQRSSAKTKQLAGAPARIVLSSSEATTQRVYCYAVVSRAAEV